MVYMVKYILLPLNKIIKCLINTAKKYNKISRHPNIKTMTRLIEKILITYLCKSKDLTCSIKLKPSMQDLRDKKCYNGLLNLSNQFETDTFALIIVKTSIIDKLRS